METSFHMSLPCVSVSSTQDFYVNKLGAKLGRHTQTWLDINLFGHQLTFIKAAKFEFSKPSYVFESKVLPTFHFGVIVDSIVWKKIYANLQDSGMKLVTESTFLEGKIGQHKSFFVEDPNGYMLEFKSFKKPTETFKH
ncbi:VOC family protein [Bizionia myxarmorum]|uniref:Bleomycin resistance protein n=1 Tax=Bizionia myxarmorum TaxID=291186 RepID=A0A5D0RDV3_9FLAO|nr:VOC family protein [Bizionia myxarmorum]TYB79131.1 bleomycin resistance protein [Bizionia myxarmorum]